MAVTGPQEERVMEGLEPKKQKRIVEILKAAGHPVRLGIIVALCEAEANVTTLAERVGATQTIVSQQLRILRMSGLVDVERVGGYAVYRVAEQRLPRLVACMVQCTE